jgi:hypothetical protein
VPQKTKGRKVNADCSKKRQITTNVCIYICIYLFTLSLAQYQHNREFKFMFCAFCHLPVCMRACTVGDETDLRVNHHIFLSDIYASSPLLLHALHSVLSRWSLLQKMVNTYTPLNLITAILVDIIFLIWKVFNILLEGVITF